MTVVKYLQLCIWCSRMRTICIPASRRQTLLKDCEKLTKVIGILNIFGRVFPSHSESA